MGAPPCTPVSPTGCRRRSLPWLPAPSRSRSLLPPRGSTPYGSVAPSSPPCLPPADVDLQAGVRRVRPIHCPPQVLLNVHLSLHSLYTNLLLNYSVLFFTYVCIFLLLFQYKLCTSYK